MDFWWVNQNQTYEHEIGGGYMWSPKRNKNGAYNQFYENMTLVHPGDLVFSFRKQKISNVGVILETGRSSPKPTEFGSQGDYWSDEGWLVPVEWHSLEMPIIPKQYINELRPTLPNKYSPLNVNSGAGLQSVYLANVPDAMAAILVSKLSPKDQKIIAALDKSSISEQEFQEDLDDKIQKQIEQSTEIDKTEIEAVVKARKGQGRYRKNLELIEKACRITGVTDKRLLRASHIKPWRFCENNHERLDGNNGLLLTPNIDLLFDQGYISFDSNGNLLLSTLIAAEQIQRLGLSTDSIYDAGGFNTEQQMYLEYHRKHIFKDTI